MAISSFFLSCIHAHIWLIYFASLLLCTVDPIDIIVQPLFTVLANLPVTWASRSIPAGSPLGYQFPVHLLFWIQSRCICFLIWLCFDGDMEDHDCSWPLVIYLSIYFKHNILVNFWFFLPGGCFIILWTISVHFWDTASIIVLWFYRRIRYL